MFGLNGFNRVSAKVGLASLPPVTTVAGSMLTCDCLQGTPYLNAQGVCSCCEGTVLAGTCQSETATPVTNTVASILDTPTIATATNWIKSNQPLAVGLVLGLGYLIFRKK